MLSIFKKNKKIFFYFGIGSTSLLFLFIFSQNVRATSVDDIQSKINQKSTDIQKLQSEIQIYQKGLNIVSSQAESLKKEVKTLDLTNKKISTDIKVTETTLSKTSLTIDQLTNQISEKEKDIKNKLAALEENIRYVRDSGNDNPLERLLSGESVSDYIETSLNFESEVKQKVDEIMSLKSEMEDKRGVKEGQKRNLSDLKKQLSGQKQVVVQTEKEKSELLTKTKNTQSAYEKVIAEKKKLQAQFENDLFNFESELKIAIDPNKLPSANNSILSWPLSKISITQLFGRTGSSARLYVSGTHNGVDFAASVGTPIRATLGGVVQATGNTDLKKNCLSYGKWILIKHSNGLSSLFGHLSVIGVNPGDQVATGQVVGYSGRTGYVTGPHLHLTVLASQGVRVMAIPNDKTVNCRGVVIPLGDTKAFLDPMIYLPKYTGTIQ